MNNVSRLNFAVDEVYATAADGDIIHPVQHGGSRDVHETDREAPTSARTRVPRPVHGAYRNPTKVVVLVVGAFVPMTVLRGSARPVLGAGPPRVRPDSAP